MRKQVILISLLVFILSLSLIMACGDAKSNAETKAKVDKTASENVKDFTLTLLDGKKLTLNDLKGKAVIIDVWDTWCPPCKAEIPHFIALYDEYKDKGLVIVGVAGGREGKEAVEKFIGDYGINYLNTMLDQPFMDSYGPINGIPTTFVLDKQGKVYQKYVGYREKSVFEADIKSILGI